MKLWLLRRNERTDGLVDYDVANGFVIRAEDEWQARVIAGAHAGDEGAGCWVVATTATCEELPLLGSSSGVVLRDYHAG